MKMSQFQGVTSIQYTNIHDGCSTQSSMFFFEKAFEDLCPSNEGPAGFPVSTPGDEKRRRRHTLYVARTQFGETRLSWSFSKEDPILESQCMVHSNMKFLDNLWYSGW